MDVVFQGVFADGDWRGVADSLEKKALRTEFDDAVGSTFRHEEHAVLRGWAGEIAGKAIDDRGNELLIVKPRSEAE